MAATDMAPLTCFQVYDLRGKLGDDLNAEIAYRVDHAHISSRIDRLQ